jgi:hypothetical protein
MRNPAPFERSLVGAVLLDPTEALLLIDRAGGLPQMTDPDAAAVARYVATERTAGRPVSAESAMTGCGLPGATWQSLADAAPLPGAVAALVRTIRELHATRHAVAILERDDAALDFKRAELARILDPLTETDASDRTDTLAGLPDPAPEAQNPAALFRGGWLRRGGGALLVAPSGVGKSVFSVQAAACWAMGQAAFGIAPVHPLRVCIVQAEDDTEEMAFFRNQIGEGLTTESGIDAGAVQAAFGKIALLEIIGATGAPFVQRLAAHLQKHETDLLIVNPLQSYFGGDLSRNSELSAFLRGAVDPLIKGPDGRGRVGVLFVHHTNKPPTAKERGGWGTDAFSAYCGAGGAELVNWARAVLALMPCEDSPGVFRLVAGKRGQRLGWVDAAGAKTNTRLIAHHERLVFWRDATETETGASERGGRGNRGGDPATDAGTLADTARKAAQGLTSLRAYAVELYGSGRGRRAFDYLIGNTAGYKLAVIKATWKGAAFIGTEPDASAAARAWDTSKGGK